MTSWSSVLDLMEARVEEVDRILLQGGNPLPELELPPGIGPLPDDLRGRAELVYALTVDAELRVEAAQSGVLAALRADREQAPAPPAYFDGRA